MSWTTQSATTRVWAQLSAITTTNDGGVDFTLRVDDQFPMRVTDDRPLFISDSSGFQTP